MECTHYHYNVCLLSFRALVVQFFSLMLVVVFFNWQCLVCQLCHVWTCVLPTIVLLCSDTTQHPSELFPIKSTQKAASLCSSHKSTTEGTQWLHQSGRHLWTLSATLPPACVNSPKLGPSAQLEYPWITAVTPWEKRPVACWSVLSRTDRLK